MRLAPPIFEQLDLTRDDTEAVVKPKYSIHG